MKHSFLFCLLVMLFFPFLGNAQSTLQVSDLQVEYLTQPIAVDVVEPRFSWKLIDQTRGQKQTAYQILVASNKELLEKEKGDLWDSGKVNSSQLAQIVYGGQKLHSNQVCFWKVRSFDKDQNPSLWSEVSSFSIGLLQNSDWKGIWMQHPTASDEKHIWFRKDFTLNQNTETAFVYVASVGYHELYINGKKVDDRVLAPSLTRLNKRVLYVGYDVKSLLKPGKNTLAIWYGPGWSRYKHYQKDITQSLKVQMEYAYKDGKTFSLSSDNSWKCKVSSSQNLGHNKHADNGGESVDARKFVTNWNQTDLDTSGWESAKEVQLNLVLSSQMSEPSRVLDSLEAKDIVEIKKGVYRIDLGKNFTGFLSLKFRNTKEGDLVKISVSDDSKTKKDFGQKYRYICKGQEVETFENRFNYTAGRYIYLSGLRTKPSQGDIQALLVGNDLKGSGSFTSSNALFNQIYDTDLWTFRINTTEGFTSDCPHRERLGYGEELFATAWGIGMPTYKAGAFYNNLMRNWTDMQEPSGWIYHTTPQANHIAWGGPLWSSAGLNIAWEYYQNYGDTKALELVYEPSRKWLEFLSQHTENGLLVPYFGFGKFLGDWAGPGGRKEFGKRRRVFCGESALWELFFCFCWGRGMIF
ncbi:MAG: hypothetical protein C4K58_00395 [Flavobacteriaceae bacterium]|nr:MAG: hypothetical protein C4K58_00395 [Flavobacteriaceae bacterium]